MRERIGRGVWSIAVAVATAVVIVTASIVPFLNPWYVGFEQERTGARALSGYSGDELRTATDAILADLMVGAGDFDVTVRGEPVLTDRERSHMRDVRAAFGGLALLAAASVAVLVAARVRATRDPGGAGGRLAGAVRRGAVGLAIAVVALGVVAFVAFDVLFEAFHRLFFASGTYTFDPSSERLVQLFPYAFWLETALAVGALIVALAVLVAVVVGRRSGERVARATAPPPSAPKGLPR